MATATATATLRPRDFFLLAGPCLAYFAAMHFRCNGWSADGVLAPRFAHDYWDVIDRYGQGLALRTSQRGTGAGLVGATLLFVALAGMVAGYGVVLRRVLLAESSEIRTRVVIGLTAVLAVPLLLTPYMLSSDVYSYVMYGRIASVHQSNPYTIPPSGFRGDPFVRRLYWHEAKMIYGPMWLYPSAGATWLLQRTGANTAAHVLTFKLMMLACHLGAIALVARIAAVVRPRRAALVTIAYAFNPLALVELAGNGHVDGLVMLLLLAGIYAHVRGRPMTALVWLVLAALTKPHMLALVGLYGLGHLRASKSVSDAARRAATMIAIAGALAVVMYAPVWAGRATFDEMVHGSSNRRFINSIAEWLVGLGAGKGMVRAVALAGFAAAVIAIVARTRSTADAVRHFAWVGLAFCLFASTWFWPWYVGFALAVALATGSRTAIVASLALSATALLIYVTFAFGTPHGGIGKWLAVHAQDGRALLVFGPALIATAIAWMQARAGSAGRRPQHAVSSTANAGRGARVRAGTPAAIRPPHVAIPDRRAPRPAAVGGGLSARKVA